jgi:hypothetical protein
MTETLIQVTFGWPAIIISILLSIVGLMLRKPALLIVAGIICMPFTYYVSNGFSNLAVVLPLFSFGSAYAITRQKKLIAWLCITPLVVIAAALAYTVLTQ